MTNKMTKEQPYNLPEKLTVPISTEMKEKIYSLANTLQKNKKRVAGEFTNRITPASLCRIGLEFLLLNQRKIEALQPKDEADLLKLIKQNI